MTCAGQEAQEREATFALLNLCPRPPSFRLLNFCFARAKYDEAIRAAAKL